MNILKLNEICRDPNTLVIKLREWGLIPQEGEYKCPKCKGILDLRPTRYHVDPWAYRCYNYISKKKQKKKKCEKSVSIRSGTFFHNSKLSVLQILCFVNCWIESANLEFINLQLDTGLPTVIDWARSCREVLLYYFMNNPQKLGGTGKIVDIEESKFVRRTYNGNNIIEERWVFGGYERGSGKTFMIHVKKRDRDTLIPIINTWIEKGTTIYSDFWRAFDCLSDQGYIDLNVNHSIHFMNSEKNCTWRKEFSCFIPNGGKSPQDPGYLARNMFKKKCDELTLDRTIHFFKLAGQLHNPANPVTDEEFMNTLGIPCESMASRDIFDNVLELDNYE